MLKKIILVLTIGLIASGFNFDSIGIHVRFDTIEGLKKKDRVFLDDVHVGHVDRVVYGDDGVYTASLKIKKNFKDSLTEHTRFVIITDPEDDDRQAVEAIQIRMGGDPLKSGSTVVGTKKYTVLHEMMKDDVKDGINYLKKEYREFENELRSLSENEKVREIKKMLTRFGRELKKESHETREKITKEIIPMLEQEIKELREQLKESGREDEVEPLEEELKKIKHI